jgi:predicted MPP superfamily phosphohydrolase
MMTTNGTAHQIKQSARELIGEVRFRLAGRPRLRRGAQRLLQTAGIGIGYAALIEPSLIETSLVEVPIHGLDRSLDGYQIAHLSDIHYCFMAGRDFLRRVVAKTNALDADMVALTGDFIARNPTNLERCMALLSDLRAPDGCWVTRGNHDYRATLGAMQTACREAGFRLLENSHAVVQPQRHRGRHSNGTRRSPRLVVAGVGDIWEGHCAPGRALAGASPAYPTIMLSHNPQAINLLPASQRLDVMLSGHTHGGQVRLLGRTMKFLTDGNAQLVAGLVRRGRTAIYISRGVGTSALRVRWNCRPEIGLIRLVAA